MRQVWLIFALVGMTSSIEISTDGLPVDAESGTGSIWTTADTDGPKVVAGLNCWKDTTESTDLNVDFRVYNQDQAEDVNGNFYFQFDTCEALDRSMIATMKVEPNPQCPATKSGTDGEYFSFTKTIDTGAAPDCGAVNEGTVWKFAVRCQRWAAYDAAEDRVFLFQCNSAVPTETLVSTLTAPMLPVGDVAKQNLIRRYRLTMDVIEATTAPDRANDVLVTAPVDLGTALWLRWCLSISGADGDTRTMFDADGFGPSGLSPHTCVATRHASQAVDMEDTTDVSVGTDGVTIVGDNGCGIGTPVAQQVNNVRAKWVKASTDGANAWMFSPNCWYLGSYEAVSFLGKTITAAEDEPDRKMTIECKLSYCTSSTSTSPNCFGDLSGTMSATYPGCSARKRRADSGFVNVTDLPESVSTDITIRMRKGSENKASKCIENTTFYALTGVLAVLLLIVLAIGGYLTLKLRKVMSDRESEDSMTGIQNKGYY